MTQRGKRRFPDGTDDPTGSITSETTSGFTGHEMIDAVGLVNMNGRIYDPQIGRFLSADPFIHEITNTQDLNRYSYVHNNPLSVTDMDGYGFFQKWWKTIVAIVVAVVLWYVAPLLFSALSAPGFGAAGTGVATINGVGLSAGAAVVNAGTAGAASGAITGGGKGALVGGLTGAAFAEVGNIFGHAVTGFGEKNFSWSNFAGRVAAHGTVGGLSSVASGGKFLSGFLSAGVSAAAGPIKFGGFAGGLVKSSVVGGFGSLLGGGKFQNGAVTAAFSYVLNDGVGDLAPDEANRKPPYSLDDSANSDGEMSCGCRRPDFYTLSVNVAIVNPWTATLVGWTGSLVWDERDNQWYWSDEGANVGKAAAVVSLGVSANWLNVARVTSALDMDSFLTGSSVNVGGGFIVGGSEMWSPGTATGVGLYTPQIGGSYSYSHRFHEEDQKRQQP